VEPYIHAHALSKIVVISPLMTYNVNIKTKLKKQITHVKNVKQGKVDESYQQRNQMKKQ